MRHAFPHRGIGEDDLAELDHVLECAEIVVHLLPRLLAEELRELGANSARDAARRLIAEIDVNLGAAATRSGNEADLALVVDVGVAFRAPRDQLVRYVARRHGVPLDGLA